MVTRSLGTLGQGLEDHRAAPRALEECGALKVLMTVGCFESNLPRLSPPKLGLSNLPVSL